MLESPDIAAIQDLERRWLACELAGRAADVLELCSTDITWLPPGQSPVRGGEAIRAWLGKPRDQVEEIRLSDVVIDGDGSRAYKLANFRTRVLMCGSTEAITIQGWHLWILRRESNHGWRVAVVAWGIEAP